MPQKLDYKALNLLLAELSVLALTTKFFVGALTELTITLTKELGHDPKINVPQTKYQAHP